MAKGQCQMPLNLPTTDDGLPSTKEVDTLASTSANKYSSDATGAVAETVKTTETNAQLLEVSQSQPQPIPPRTASMAYSNNGVRVPIHPTMPSDPPLDSTHVDNEASKSRKRGDFEGDLLPGGPLQPPFGIEDNFSATPPGSQVGPDHHIFDRTFGDDDYYDYNDEYQYGQRMGSRDGFGLPGLPSGMGMRPRFDPFEPPGGPTDPGRGGRFPGRGGVGRGRGGRGGRSGGRMTPPGGFGDPNHDPLTPSGGVSSVD